MSWSEGFPAPEETHIPEAEQAKEAEFSDAPQSTEAVEQSEEKTNE